MISHLLPTLSADLIIIKDIHIIFGPATGLRTNFGKFSVAHTSCRSKGRDHKGAYSMRQCVINNFPFKRLGLPLTVRKLMKIDLQPFLDNIANRCWAKNHRCYPEEGARSSSGQSSTRPWSEFKFNLHGKIISQIGDVNKCLFWEDGWPNGKSI